jgi:hypothetical protein
MSILPSNHHHRVQTKIPVLKGQMDESLPYHMELIQMRSPFPHLRQVGRARVASKPVILLVVSDRRPALDDSAEMTLHPTFHAKPTILRMEARNAPMTQDRAYLWGP